VPFNSMVLSLPDAAAGSAPYNNDALQPRLIAQAALKANPDMQFIVGTSQRFDSVNDPRFQQVRADIANRLGVPPANVLPVRGTLAWFPRDEFMAGSNGAVSKPGERRDLFADSTGERRTFFGANEMARELGLRVNLAPGIGRGGDTHVIERNGQQAVLFGEETIRYTASNHGLSLESNKDRLLAIALTMNQMDRVGIPPERATPLGMPTLREDGKPVTYGDVLRQMTPEQLAPIPSNVLSQLQRMHDLPFPTREVGYPPTPLPSRLTAASCSCTSRTPRMLRCRRPCDSSATSRSRCPAANSITRAHLWWPKVAPTTFPSIPTRTSVHPRSSS
jgi:hypothetical protein